RTIPLDPWLSLPLHSATACSPENRHRRASAVRCGQPRIQDSVLPSIPLTDRDALAETYDARRSRRSPLASLEGQRCPCPDRTARTCIDREEGIDGASCASRTAGCLRGSSEPSARRPRTRWPQSCGRSAGGLGPCCASRTRAAPYRSCSPTSSAHVRDAIGRRCGSCACRGKPPVIADIRAGHADTIQILRDLEAGFVLDCGHPVYGPDNVCFGKIQAGDGFLREDEACLAPLALFAITVRHDAAQPCTGLRHTVGVGQRALTNNRVFVRGE